MTQLLLYIIESSICLTTFWVIYWLFLKSETFFKLNRIYLQITLLLSFVIPFISIGIKMSQRVNTGIIVLQEVVVYAYKIKASSATYIDPFNWVVILIFAGSIVGLVIFIKSLLQINKLVKGSKLLKINGVTVVANKYIKSTFVFKNRIFIPLDTLEGVDINHVIQHELVHIIQKHSIDNMVVTIVLLIMWFNPFAWLYREAFREIHEFIADSEVLKNGIDTHDYKISILKSIVDPGYKYINYFNVSFIKKRLIMMSKIKSPKKNIVKIAILVPVLSLLVLVFSCEPKTDKVSVNNDVTGVQKITDKPAKVDNIADVPAKVDKLAGAPAKVNSSEKIYDVVDVMPEYIGMNDGATVAQDLQKYITYPETAKKAGIEAKIYVSFVVFKNGTIGDIAVKKFSKIGDSSVECPSGIKTELENSAIKAVGMLKNWKPGKVNGEPASVKYVLPIRYSLQ